jgi:hypothetical protein
VGLTKRWSKTPFYDTIRCGNETNPGNAPTLGPRSITEEYNDFSVFSRDRGFAYVLISESLTQKGQRLAASLDLFESGQRIITREPERVASTFKGLFMYTGESTCVSLAGMNSCNSKVSLITWISSFIFTAYKFGFLFI